jgi:N-acetylglucosamine-6-phosphate deacetylase
VHRRYETRIAVGHHLADRQTLRGATEHGATLITHLGNGCPNLLPRHNNPLIHQLANDALSAGIIADGHHIPEDFIRIVFRCKGVERIFVVSDCVPIAGSKPGIYETLGNKVRLTEEGRVESLSRDYLVGSGCNMAQCIHYLRSLDFLSDGELWRVGLENPLKILGRSLAPEILAGQPDFDMNDE